MFQRYKMVVMDTALFDSTGALLTFLTVQLRLDQLMLDKVVSLQAHKLYTSLDWYWYLCSDGI